MLLGSLSIRYQPPSKPGVYTDSVRSAEHAISSRGYPDRLGDDPLVYGSILEAQQMGFPCASAIPYLGIAYTALQLSITWMNWGK